MWPIINSMNLLFLLHTDKADKDSMCQCKLYPCGPISWSWILLFSKTAWQWESSETLHSFVTNEHQFLQLWTIIQVLNLIHIYKNIYIYVFSNSIKEGFALQPKVYCINDTPYVTQVKCVILMVILQFSIYSNIVYNVTTVF